MPAVTNDHDRCELLNLASNPNGRGPFAIRQIGYPPGSMTQNEAPFLLRDDGVWVLNLVVFTLPEAEQHRFIYATSADAVQSYYRLHGEAIVEHKLPEGTTSEKIIDGLEKAASRLLQNLRNAKPTLAS